MHFQYRSSLSIYFLFYGYTDFRRVIKHVVYRAIRRVRSGQGHGRTKTKRSQPPPPHRTRPPTENGHSIDKRAETFYSALRNDRSFAAVRCQLNILLRTHSWARRVQLLIIRRRQRRESGERPRLAADIVPSSATPVRLVCRSRRSSSRFSFSYVSPHSGPATAPAMIVVAGVR